MLPRNQRREPLTDSSRNALERLIGMIRAPRATLNSAVARPRSLDMALLIIAISTICSVGFLMTRVGQLAALDQQVRQLESFGTVVDDEMYAALRSWVPYRPAISAAVIVIGWPTLWLGLAAIMKTVARLRGGAASALAQGASAEKSSRPIFGQVLTVVVHASAVFALRSVIATPLNYARESLGGATSLSTVMPAFAESTVPARLLGAVDIFVLWWIVLAAMGLSMVYETRILPIAGWLLGAYAGGAAVLALAQALRGGI